MIQIQSLGPYHLPGLPEFFFSLCATLKTGRGLRTRPPIYFFFSRCSIYMYVQDSTDLKMVTFFSFNFSFELELKISSKLKLKEENITIFIVSRFN